MGFDLAAPPDCIAGGGFGDLFGFFRRCAFGDGPLGGFVGCVAGGLALVCGLPLGLHRLGAAIDPQRPPIQLPQAHGRLLSRSRANILPYWQLQSLEVYAGFLETAYALYSWASGQLASDRFVRKLHGKSVGSQLAVAR